MKGQTPQDNWAALDPTFPASALQKNEAKLWASPQVQETGRDRVQIVTGRNVVVSQVPFPSRSQNAGDGSGNFIRLLLPRPESRAHRKLS